MIDLAAIMALHIPWRDDLNGHGFNCCKHCSMLALDNHVSWPCDTAIVLAALDAALAREARLREALADLAGFRDDQLPGWLEPFIEEARAALDEPTP